MSATFWSLALVHGDAAGGSDENFSVGGERGKWEAKWFSSSSSPPFSSSHLGRPLGVQQRQENLREDASFSREHKKGIQIWIGLGWEREISSYIRKCGFCVNFDKRQHKQSFSTIRKKIGALWESVVSLVWVILQKFLIYWLKTPDAVDILSVWCKYFHLPGRLISPSCHLYHLVPHLCSPSGALCCILLHINAGGGGASVKCCCAAAPCPLQAEVACRMQRNQLVFKILPEVLMCSASFDCHKIKS